MSSVAGAYIEGCRLQEMALDGSRTVMVGHEGKEVPPERLLFCEMERGGLACPSQHVPSKLQEEVGITKERRQPAKERKLSSAPLATGGKTT